MLEAFETAFATALVIGTICGIIANIAYHRLSPDTGFIAISAIIFAGWIPTLYFAMVGHSVVAQVYTGSFIAASMIGALFAGCVRSLFGRH